MRMRVSIRTPNGHYNLNPEHTVSRIFDLSDINVETTQKYIGLRTHTHPCAMHSVRIYRMRVAFSAL